MSEICPGSDEAIFIIALVGLIFQGDQNTPYGRSAVAGKTGELNATLAFNGEHLPHLFAQNQNKKNFRMFHLL